MKKAIILHGICDEDEYFEMDFPSPSNAHWLPWLQQKFLRAGVLCQTLEMPTPYQPSYKDWLKTFQQIDQEDLAYVIGHSAGCGFMLQYFEQNPNFRPQKFIMVAPWIDPKKRKGNFLNISLPKELLKGIEEVHILISDDDDESVQISVEKIIKAYPNIKLHQFHNKGHFCLSEIGPTFPELWEICIK